MRISKTVQQPAKEVVVLDKVVCDFKCGAEAPDDDKWPAQRATVNRTYRPGVYGPETTVTGGKPCDSYEFRKVRIDFRHWENWDGDVVGSKLAYDICPQCFQEKVLPALIALGLPPRKLESSEDIYSD